MAWLLPRMGPGWFAAAARAVLMAPLDGWREVWKDIQALMAVDFQKQYPRPIIALALFILPLMACWVLYVPIHELMHMAGALLAGCQDFTLEIDAVYGGRLLAKLMPDRIKVGSEYAGRLTDFETGSDLGYLLLVFAPFLLTLPGVPLFRWAIRRMSLPLLGGSALLALAPFINLWGDFNEIGAILSTRIYSLIHGLPRETFHDLRRSSDDLLRTLGDLPALLPPGVSILAGGILVGGGFLLGLAAAGLIYRAGALLADRWEAP